MKFLIFESDSLDPCRNLAIEEYLLRLAEDAAILYLWQNQHTVVIGRNQNPWKECRTTLLQQEGGHLVRRLSGGGAVFHDLGNLNFTFLMPHDCFDLTKQFCVVLDALAELGIQAHFTGRNDITVEGRKFSGNAFYKNGRAAYHHGTLLVDADMEKLTRYLSPSKAKLQSKGVDSVRSRVVNLKELNPKITIDQLKTELIRAFSRIYGPAEAISIPQEALSMLTEKYRGWEWNYGQKLPFTVEWEERFSWGSLQLQLQIENGIIRDAKIYSDSMDWEVGPELETRLKGCRFERGALEKRLGDTGAAADVFHMLCSEML